MKRDFEADQDLLNQDILNIEDIQSQTICNYFLRLNENNFEGFAALFSTDGLLFPPFESAIGGRDAICQYLQTTGIEVKASPQ
ncbi:MAG: nuclear transport factor 2 family protein, partial [Cyanobacteria bacterium CAN_BIN43]|nr:nuclear transport factor 2 family protein [Cyanobacteria bacterium CAN_BIN43]